MTTTAASVPPVVDDAQMARLQQWVGRERVSEDAVCAAPMAAFAAMLDRDDPPPAAGTVIPPLAHWMYFLPADRHGELGPDGHAERGVSLPPVPLPRRMWAGSRLRWETGNPLRVGDHARRVSRVQSVTHKRGRGGDMVFVLQQHQIHNAQGLCITEEQDIVYRGAAVPGTPLPDPVAAETAAPWQREITPDPVLLFRYSALTFNGHRIHYDRDYATGVEGYPGLVVHGPLLATLLLDLVRRSAAPGTHVRSFEFRAVRPTFDLHPFLVRGRPSADGQGVALWAHDHEGWLTVRGSAELERTAPPPRAMPGGSHS